MDVIVAGKTSGFERFVADGFGKAVGESTLFHRMASLAWNLTVLSGERVAAFGMIESCFLESFNNMAWRAVNLELSYVWILAVAVAAVLECYFGELLVDMAVGTWNRSMCPTKWIASLFMIECGYVPGVRVVTSLAVASKARLMRILMAMDALSEAKSFPLLVRMAFDAVDPLMCANQGKIGPVVIERNLTKFVDEGVAPIAIFA